LEFLCFLSANQSIDKEDLLLNKEDLSW